ncbi:chorismate-binding protein [Chryseobacterium salipaludis]|uniref:chorismate-binding protein n=1 Tax=Chryseobacterium TaxID=59732 RepID=UPI001FF30D2F|nr:MULTISPECIES: chorismate-binding protein [Chryseobacterium]MCJ8498846.1 chorismate-binding protein [Chryseobacterium salipaludis]MCX3297784.1 chorismate-binding protein [Planobacterium sp. JC490]
MIYFRFPFSGLFYTVDGDTSGAGVQFISFNSREQLQFPGRLQTVSAAEIITESAAKKLDELPSVLRLESQAEYEEKLQHVINFIKEHQLPKLVISRRKLADFGEKEVNLAETFLNMCAAYPNAFVYIFQHQGECWTGAFSEVLGKYTKATGEFSTMALAATLPLADSWTKKEIEEQQPVADFIKTVLEPYDPDVQQGETTDHISGNIKHLRTDFKATLKPGQLDQVILGLHPTPAVCGIPKDFCQRAIESFESHDRKWYSGYIRVETEDEVQCFVNLRCAALFDHAALMYAGGGITADSNPAAEWRETELKAEAVLKNIVFK